MAKMERLARNYGDPTGWWKVHWVEADSEDGKAGTRSRTIEGRQPAELFLRLVEDGGTDHYPSIWVLRDHGLSDLATAPSAEALYQIGRIIGYEDLSAADRIARVRKYLDLY